jgi:hypothetical protein
VRPIRNGAKGRHRIKQGLARVAPTARARGLRAWVLTLSLVSVSVAALAAATGGSASATTKCAGPGDFGATYLSAAWPGGFTGVPVYSNDYPTGGSNPTCTNYATTPSGKSVPSGYEWQCVELVNRLYISKGWISARWTGNGNQMYATAPAALKKQPQGSIAFLAPGDVVSFNTGHAGGHAAVVSQVTGAAVTFVNENTPKSEVLSTGTLSGGKLAMTGWAKSFAPIGVVHSPLPQKLPAQPASPKVASVKSTSAALTWTDASNNETGFVSQYRVGSGSWVTGPSAGANTNSVTVTGLKASTSYTFQVGARNSAGTHWSAYFTATTAKQPAPAPTPTPPPAYHAGRQVTIDTHATGGVSGHKGPGNTYAAGPTRLKNSALWIVCYVTGQPITGPYDTTDMWDLSDDGSYYTDAWLYTGVNGAVVPKCALKTVTVDKHATGGVSGHKGPGNSYAAGPTHAVNTAVTIACYVTGQSITGPYDTTTMWDLANDGYYYTDAWLYTGINGAAVPHC